MTEPFTSKAELEAAFIAVMDILEQECILCKGSGRWEVNAQVKCRTCDGTGTVPTDAGHRLLCFIANWPKYVRDEIR